MSQKTGANDREDEHSLTLLGSNMTDTTVTLSDGRHLAVTETGGAGASLVLLHGWACRRADWDGFLAAVGDRFACLAPDLPGHGDSAAQPGQWSVAGMAADVVDLVRAKGLERPVLVGHSMGGAVAMEAAARLGDVAAVVLIDTFVIPYGDLSEQDAAGIERGFRDDFAAAVARLVDNNTSDLMSDAAKHALAGAMQQADPARMLPLWADLLRWNPEPAFTALEGVPLYAINGEMIPEPAQQRCRDRVIEHRLAGAAHFPHLEMPERFNDALKAVLDKIGDAKR